MNNILSGKYIYVLYINEKQKKRFINYISKSDININYNLFKGAFYYDVIDKIKHNYNKSPLTIINEYNHIYKKELISWFYKRGKNIHNKILKYIGQYGHISSFINIIEDAIRKDLNEIIVFEYDIFIHNDIVERLKDFNNISEKCDIVYFGNSMHFNPSINNDTYNISNIAGTFAIYIKKTIFKDLLELLKLFILPTDEIMIILQQKYKCYVYTPNIIISDVSKSSIAPKFKNDITKYYTKFKWNINDYKIIKNIDEYLYATITIILYIYGDISSINNTISSILNQTYSKFKLIIIDNKKVVELYKYIYSLNDNRIKIVNNFNINKCSTDYIAYISTMNLYHQEALQKYIDTFNKYSNAFIINGQYQYIGGNFDIIRCWNIDNNKIGKIYKKDFLTNNITNGTSIILDDILTYIIL
tara:strand:+ start:297 stop:1544 length:1248 start_codon:yes stop_codon:yes gene_type:complete